MFLSSPRVVRIACAVTDATWGAANDLNTGVATVNNVAEGGTCRVFSMEQNQMAHAAAGPQEVRETLGLTNRAPQ